MTRPLPALLAAALLVPMTGLASGAATPGQLRLANGTLDGWTATGDPACWAVLDSPPLHVHPADPPRFVATSHANGERHVGALRSAPFTIEAPVQSFSLAGWDTREPAALAEPRNVVRLLSHPDGEVLRVARTPGGNTLAPVRWSTVDLIGREVVLEAVDGVADDAFAWLAFADYTQETPVMNAPVERDDLTAVELGEGAELVVCRSVPFLASGAPSVGEDNPIHVGATADTLLLLGMVNQGWDAGLAHWGEHPETWDERPDQLHAGVEIGAVEVRYADGDVDRLPLVIGATAWFVAGWAHGPSHNHRGQVREPFVSRPELRAVLDASLRLREADGPASNADFHKRYLLALKPRPKKIDRLVVLDNPAKRGQPLISGVTLVGAQDAGTGLRALPAMTVDAEDLAPALDLAALPDFSPGIEGLARALTTREQDLPRAVEPMPMPEGLDAARLTFHATTAPGDFDLAGMVNNAWVANLDCIDRKFEPGTGMFHETEEDSPWYGGYSGLGSWAPVGVYHDSAFSRCSDHFATMFLRAVAHPDRGTAYVDYVDHWLYYFRANHDPAEGPPNDALDIARYPADAPGHWAFVVSGPLSPPWPLNELQGVEEMDGHASNIIGRWWTWRLHGSPAGDWLTAPRPHVFHKSRWHATKQAADFICWLMEHTGRDVIYSEGEATGWGGGPAGTPASQIPEGWWDETDPEVCRRHYAEKEIFFQTYPTWLCAVALRVSAEMADAAGEAADAARWRQHADRIQRAMLAEMAVGEPGAETWKYCHHSVFPSHNEALVQAFTSIYLDGFDPADWDPELAAITRRTLGQRLARKNGGRAVIAMGYGQGWLLHSALVFDEIDAASRALRDLMVFSYDKNMDYHDPARGIEWRRYQWIFPEGTNVLPDGSWHRIGDLSNGANQGPPMHALLFAAGVDDTRPGRIRVMPRVMDPMQGLDVENLQTVIATPGGKRDVARVAYRYRRGESFELRSDKPLPGLQLRLGPFASEAAASAAVSSGLPHGASTRAARSGTWGGAPAWWLWIEDIGEAREVLLRLAAGE